MFLTFEPALRLLLRHEGGFVNNPEDPGGMTNLGVTKHQWESYLSEPVTEADMRALTADRVAPFYKNRYWNTVQADKLPAGVDNCLFDCCVNSGPGRAVKILQEVLGLTQDGIIGGQTIAAALTRSVQDTIRDYTNARLTFLKTLSTWSSFGKGWEARVVGVQAEALAFAASDK